MRPLVVVLLVCWVASLQAATVRLRWDPSDSPDVIGYRVYQGIASGNYNTMRDVGAVTETVISELIPGETYYWTATAYTAAGAESLYSNEVQWTIPVEPDTTLPVVAITYPIHDSMVTRKSTVFVTIDVEEANEIALVELSVNGITVCPIRKPVVPITCGWQVPAPPRREYRLQAMAWDVTGNLGVSEIVRVTSQ